MRHSIKQTSVMIYSGIGVLTAAAVTAAVFVGRYLSMRKRGSRDLPDATVEENPPGPSLVEDLVAHNPQGF